ncbi:DoxX family protein [Pleionea sp. CnH1-48]|uniref:DoxX family protein n=1 Tax=Pleionea sp. CnH1-48 TaxID=2954494 RepID=UPI002097661A|nr:DoxX family protein [Pleionea sp. CnH1-48]MCO7222817.1 DoxX family protein [Pleionea sp. CnH1-48]
MWLDKILLGIVGLIFLLSGGAKLAGLDFELAAFERWGYPLWFMYLTGGLEVVGAAGLMHNKLQKLAAPGLALLMVGAMATHIKFGEWPALAVAGVIFLVTCVLCYRLLTLSKH